MSDYRNTDSESEISNEDITTKIPRNFQNEYRMYYKKIVNPELSRVKSHIFVRKNTDT